MTPLPKKKHTKSRTGKRRANKKLALKNFVVCQNCKKLKLPHVACAFCGYYHKETKQRK